MLEALQGSFSRGPAPTRPGASSRPHDPGPYARGAVLIQPAVVKRRTS
jgi:hypothetical protein